MVANFPGVPRSTEVFSLSNAARVGGISLGGTQQVVVNPASFWRARLGLKLRKVDHYLAMRAFLAGLDGQAGTFTVGPIDWRGQPWYRNKLFGGEVTPGVARQAQSAGDFTGQLNFALADTALINTTNISVTRLVGGFLKPGQYFQLGDRLHVITALLTTDPADPATGLAAPGAVIQVSIRPWLKANFGAGTVLNFTNPKAIMRISDADPSYPEMVTSPVQDLTINLIEA